MMKVLIACEYSGVVRDAFIARGHAAISCDLLPTDAEGPHYQGDIFDIENVHTFDLMVAHPPCTFLCSSGLHWNERVPGRAAMTEAALDFVQRLLDVPVPRIALENPVGCISTRIRKPDQYIHPHEFGHPESKKTGLWLKGLPKLTPTNICEPPGRRPNGAPQWLNQTASGQNNLPPSADRWKERAKTYAGIAAAMADQWGA